jgi:hypothetical protein
VSVRTQLARGAIFEITAHEGVVTCQVVNRPDVGAEEGARCASLMNEVLTERVLTPISPYRGLIFDVRQGPSAFGPKTRAALEQVFAAADTYRKLIAVVVSGSPTQRLQFGNLCREKAPARSAVFDDELEAQRWLTAPRS